MVGLGQEGFAWGWGNSLKCLKRGCGGRTEGRETDFKKAGEQAGSRGLCLKKGGGGLEPPYKLCSLPDSETLFLFLGLVMLFFKGREECKRSCKKDGILVRRTLSDM